MLKKNLPNYCNMNKYIIDLLDYSRCAKIDLKTEEVHLDELLDEITNNLKFMNSANTSIDFKKQIKSDIPFFSDRRIIYRSSLKTPYFS